MALRERMMEASSTGKVTMVDWNKAFDKMLRSRDVYQTISEIESTGNNAEYHSADVTDVEKLEKIGAIGLANHWSCSWSRYGRF